MTDTQCKQDSLVLYKTRPARVTGVSDKIEIELEGGKQKRVRPVDVQCLHPGPLRSLAELRPCEGNIEEGWELLAGEQTTVGELAEIIYGESSPATAWAAWQLVADRLYFEGIPQSITARDADQVRRDREARASQLAEEAAWAAFVDRVNQGRIEECDRPRLSEVEQVALERLKYSRLMQALGHQETPENAHRLLCEVGYWPKDFNPVPVRLGVPLTEIELAVPDLPAEERLDLTHLPAFAVDDEGNEDPDDAISIDGDLTWVHVADVAALVSPGSEMDLEACVRGANLYLPEGLVGMLPQGVTDRLGLGLNEISPALSFGFRVNSEGALADIRIQPTWIKATRLSYQQAETQMVEPLFAALSERAKRFRARRKAAGAVEIDLPEVSVRVVDGEVKIRPLERLASRDVVAETMLMAGAAAAQYSLERKIPMPFASQAAAEGLPPPPEGPAAMSAFRRFMKPSQVNLSPSAHFGLGLAAYLRVTSPLRRYADLVAHQQLRTHISGGASVDETTLAQRIDASNNSGALVRKAERLSNMHWKLVFLRGQRGWQGEGVVVEVAAARATVLIPSLALETRVRTTGELQCDSRVTLILKQVNIEDREVFFQLNQAGDK